jgi:hypothetical protein
MKIKMNINNIKKKRPTFGMLNSGDCFVLYGEVHMKIDSIDIDEENGFNSIRLSDGSGEWLYDNDEITPVNVKAKVVS